MSAVCPNGHTSESEDYCDTCGSPIDPTAVIPAGGSGGSAAGGLPGVTGSGPATGGSTPAGTPATGGQAASSLDLDPAAPAAPTGGSPGTATPPVPAGIVCPNCQFENIDGALFCEACGYDFTTGAMPRGSSTPAGGSSESSGPAAPAFVWVAEIWVDPDWYATQEAEDPCPSPGLPTIIPLRERSVLMGRVSSSKNTRPEIDLSSDPGVSRRHAQLTTDGKRWFVEDLGSSNGTFVGPAAGPLPDKAIATGPKTEMDADDRLYVGAWTRVVVREATPEEIEAYA